MKGEWLLWLSQSGRVIEASDDLCRELGYSKADITSLIIAPISEDDPVVNWSERWRTLCLVGLETYSAHLMARSGQLIPVAVRATYTKIDSVEHDCALLSLSRNADTVASGSSEAESTANAWMSYSFYEAMSEGVAFHRVVTDSNGAPVDYVILDVNSKYTEVVGKSRADVIGKLATEVYGAGEAPYLAIYAGVARTGQNTQFEVFYPPLAKFLHISVVSFKRDYFATIFTDQTDAKLRTAQTDVLLREARVNAAGLDAAIESLARGVFICDTDAKIVRVNAEATSILGYTLDDDIKTAWDVKVLLEPETVDGQTITPELHLFSNALKDHRYSGVVLNVRRKDGNRIWTSWNSSPIKSRSGDILGAIVSFTDITARVRLQHALEVNQARLTAQLQEMDFLFEHTPVGLFSLDANLKIVGYNKIFSGIATGLPGLQPGANLASILPPLAQSLSQFNEALFERAETLHNIEVCDDASTDGDKQRWWLTSYYPRTDESGRVIGLLGAVLEITDSKRREAAMIRNSSLLERVEEIERLGYWELDLQTNALWGSKVAREIYGLTSDAIDFPQIQAGSLPEYRAKLDRALDDLIRNNAKYDIEFQIKRANDDVVLDVRSRAVYHQEDRKIIGVVQDITERKTALANLRKLSQAIEQNPASIVITDPNGAIEYVNPKFTDVTGYTPEEVIGKNPRFLRSEFTPDASYQDLWQTVLSGRVWRGNFCNTKKNGDLYWESATILPIFNSRGQLANYVAVKEDITERINTDIELAAISARATRRLEYLQVTHDVELAIRTATNLSELQSAIVSEFSRALKMDGVALWMDKTDSPGLTPVVERVPTNLKNGDPQLKLRERLIDRAVDDNRAHYVRGADCANLGFPTEVRGFGLLPLTAHGQLVGALEFRSNQEIVLDDEWWNCLETIGAVCALALHNTHLFEQVRNAHSEVVAAYDATLEGWSRALDLRDSETEGHSQRVTSAAVKLARHIGLSDEEIKHIRRGALLHDVGKLGIPDRILGKPGKLTDEEWQIMKLHPGYACEWLSRVQFLLPSLDIPRDHHEHWDGKGYPRGLSGIDIPIAARLFTIIDVWDALTNDRVYRPAWSRTKAREYLLDRAGKLFDPSLVPEFIKLLDAGEIS